MQMQSENTATHCNTPQYTATLCNTLQHTATHCKTMRHNATHCNTLHDVLIGISVAGRNSVLHITTHCNTLQSAATHCITPASEMPSRTSCMSESSPFELYRTCYKHKEKPQQNVFSTSVNTAECVLYVSKYSRTCSLSSPFEPNRTCYIRRHGYSSICRQRQRQRQRQR